MRVVYHRQLGANVQQTVCIRLSRLPLYIALGRRVPGNYIGIQVILQGHAFVVNRKLHPNYTTSTIRYIMFCVVVKRTHADHFLNAKTGIHKNTLTNVSQSSSIVWWRASAQFLLLFQDFHQRTSRPVHLNALHLSSVLQALPEPPSHRSMRTGSRRQTQSPHGDARCGGCGWRSRRPCHVSCKLHETRYITF